MILDTRGREESVDQLIEEIRKEIASIEIEVLGVEQLGRREFARVTDPGLTAGNYVQFKLAGPPETSTRLNEHFRLNPVVYRIVLEQA